MHIFPFLHQLQNHRQTCLKVRFKMNKQCAGNRRCESKRNGHFLDNTTCIWTLSAKLVALGFLYLYKLFLKKIQIGNRHFDD